jgi:type II restriction enzyme
MYHVEANKIYKELLNQLTTFKGGTSFKIGDIKIAVQGKDGLGGLIEEWFGVWAKKNKFNITSSKENGSSQEFPDYYIGDDKALLEIKSFDASAGANFDLANFDSYCESVANLPERANADYMIFSYILNGSELNIQDIWIKKIWEITCPSARYPLKTQVKKDVIYNIRPSSWYAKNPQFKSFTTKENFITALFDTQQKYKENNYLEVYLNNIS